MTEHANKVSIRAPIRGPGRLLSPSFVKPVLICFNPRPDPRTGATPAPMHRRRRIPVSIRAPIRGPGRHFSSVFGCRWTWFQSAPRSEDRGDPSTPAARPTLDRFNPRPDPRTGATMRFTRPGPATSCFNPRPDPRTGATPRPDRPRARTLTFQSAPRSEDRGDVEKGVANASPGLFQSAPRSEDGATTVYLDATLEGLFQSAPRSEDRGDSTSI